MAYYVFTLETFSNGSVLLFEDVEQTEEFLAELNLLSCYDFIEQSCEYILKQLSVMQKRRDLDQLVDYRYICTCQNLVLVVVVGTHGQTMIYIANQMNSKGPDQHGGEEKLSMAFGAELEKLPNVR
ncbi:hypothetical protein LOK49_LG12G01814 [Camellia lanceoleosa]|uniref:Uncharacterized protein n=1 Tax=Camellia lanceoleosa TaxID=1840588 RepID=A0ACC0FXQ0_9ERIC|nr:hypothetical protein LOK49_LG12G01814 [Camellia lanceoleosa]